MAITLIQAVMLLTEHNHRPITGSLVSIGRHTVLLTAEACDNLLKRMEVSKREGHRYELDDQTVGAERTQAFISMESFFGAFSDARIDVLDVSDYEGANIVADLQNPLPPGLAGTADFVINGSCLDNIFNPAAAIQGMSEMLKPGGRVYHFEQGNSHPTAYLKYSADWFMDFYAFNEYEDCKTYVVNYPDTFGLPLGNTHPSQMTRRNEHVAIVYQFSPYINAPGGEGYDCSSIEAFSRYEIHCLAEKGGSSTNDRCPIQKHYRTSPEHQKSCLDSVRRFYHSKRPVCRSLAEFSPESIPRIDSSYFPEQVSPVSVIPYSIVLADVMPCQEAHLARQKDQMVNGLLAAVTALQTQQTRQTALLNVLISTLSTTMSSVNGKLEEMEAFYASLRRDNSAAEQLAALKLLGNEIKAMGEASKTIGERLTKIEKTVSRLPWIKLRSFVNKRFG
jgi:SAM-dependent methyltransferase